MIRVPDADIAEIEEAHADQTHARAMKMLAAADEPGFAGELRSAINAARCDPFALAADCGVDVTTLEAFRAGEGELPSSVIERLVDRLGLHLAPADVVECGRG